MHLHSLNSDEFTDMADTAQLEVRGRTVFIVLTEEKIHTILLLKEKTRDKNVFNAFKEYASDIKYSYKNLCQ
jgi:hypothetical protein